MRKRLVYAAVAALAVQFAGAPMVRANEHHGDDMMMKHGEWKEERMDKLTKRLNLTADQKTKVEAALKSREEKMKAMHEDMMAKHKSIADDSDKEIEAILNDKQKAEF